MSQRDPTYTTNLLLQALADEDLELLKPHLTRVKLDREDCLVTANEPIEHVYFPEGGIASVVSDMPETGAIETGIFGYEGVTALPAILGSDTAPTRTFIQVDGSTALRIGLTELRAAMAQRPAIQLVLLRYVQTMFTQVTHSAVTNAHHRMEARLARWLLMCHDRVTGDEILLTHEFMAMMIGVQRTGVTVTLHILEGGGAIRSKRGRVTILDRERLEDLAGDAYGAPEAEYRRLIGPFGRSPAASA